MKQRHAVVVLFLLILASSLTSLESYRMTEEIVMKDMDRALEKTLAEQKCDVINADTIHVFNSYLQLEKLRGKAVLAIDTRQSEFHCYAKCSMATIFSMSEQRPAMVLWLTTILWGIFCLYQKPRMLALAQTRLHESINHYGGLQYSKIDGRFFDAQGEIVKLTPMQQQLMEMFFLSSSHQLTKTEICNALWPKKEDASETLYTLIKRLKPVIEKHSNLKIEVDRGRSYQLKIK